jgi:Flp pilus assembly protein TadG
LSGVARRHAARSADTRSVEGGQSLVEFAIIVPLLLFILLAILDFSRVFTTMLTVEAAAREAADYGTQYPWYWEGDPTDPSSNAGKTVEGMRNRACVAAKHLTDYVGPDTGCTNPTFAYTLVPPTGVMPADCWQQPRAATPCNVRVTLDYTFHVIVPLRLAFFDTELGLPSTVPFQKSSVFAISDFEIDEPLAPTPSPVPSP